MGNKMLEQFTCRCITNEHFYLSTFQCEGQSATRVNDLRTYVQQIKADATLSPTQKQEYILGKVMEGNNKAT